MTFLKETLRREKQKARVAIKTSVDDQNNLRRQERKNATKLQRTSRNSLNKEGSPHLLTGKSWTVATQRHGNEHKKKAGKATEPPTTSRFPKNEPQLT
jgi:hypothetical protein